MLFKSLPSVTYILNFDANELVFNFLADIELKLNDSESQRGKIKIKLLFRGLYKRGLRGILYRCIVEGDLTCKIWSHGRTSAVAAVELRLYTTRDIRKCSRLC